MTRSLGARITRLEDAYTERFLSSPGVAEFIAIYQTATRELVGDEAYAKIAARILELASQNN